MKKGTISAIHQHGSPANVRFEPRQYAILRAVHFWDTLPQRRYIASSPDNALSWKTGRRPSSNLFSKALLAGDRQSSSSCAQARPFSPEYSYLLARDGAFREHAIQSMTGTSGRQRVQVDALAQYLLPFPPVDVWANFSSLVSPVFASIELSRKASRSIAIQRDALLPKLVSGEFRFEKEPLHGEGK